MNEKKKDNVTLMFFLTTLAFFAVAATAYYFAVLRPTGRWQGLFPIQPEAMDLIWLALGCGCPALILGIMTKLAPSMEAFYSPEAAEMAHRYTLIRSAGLYIANAFIEELLFRGALQVWLGLFPAAILFTLVHVAYYKKPLLLVYVLCMGIFLGFLYEWSGSLWICTIAHTFNNLFTMWLIRTGRLYARSNQIGEG